MARPTKYRTKYVKELIAYFDQPPTYQEDEDRYYKGDKYTVKVTRVSEFPSFERFASSIGVVMSTLWEWQQAYPEFSNAYKKAQQLQEALLVQNSIMGRYQGPFAVFYLKNKYSYVDRAELTGAEGAPLMPVGLDSAILNRHTQSGDSSSSATTDSSE